MLSERQQMLMAISLSEEAAASPSEDSEDESSGASGTNTGDEEEAAAEAVGAAAEPELPDEVKQLVDMGYPQKLAVTALKKAKGDLMVAVQICMSRKHLAKPREKRASKTSGVSEKERKAMKELARTAKNDTLCWDCHRIDGADGEQDLLCCDGPVNTRNLDPTRTPHPPRVSRDWVLTYGNRGLFFSAGGPSIPAASSWRRSRPACGPAPRALRTPIRASTATRSS